jgi:hypothetical protein
MPCAAADRHFRHALLALTLGVICLVRAVPATAQGATAEPGPFRVLAAQLVEGIEARGARLDEQTGVAEMGPRLRVALWPFATDEVPIPVSLANEYNDKLLAALIDLGGDKYEFVARGALKQLMSEVSELGYPTKDLAAPVSEIVTKARVDVLIVGKLRRSLEDQVILSYKAVAVEDGEILAGTDHQTLPLSPREARAAGASLTLEAGIEGATRHLAENARDMRELRLGGVRHGLSGVQTAFGRYLQQRTADALQAAFTDLLTGGRLLVAPAGLGKAGIEAPREVAAAAPALPGAPVEDTPGVYLLRGSYWTFGQTIELRLSLLDAGGTVATWRDRIRADSVPDGLGLHPEEDIAALRETDAPGPVELRLSSARGKDPLYRIGENLQLLIQTAQDAWLYCYYRQSDGRIVKIFPNPFHEDPRIPGGTIHSIPGDIAPFDLKFTEPGGIEVIKCFATGQDVTDELSPPFGRNALRPLPVGAGSKLPSVFRRLDSGGISEASLVITVEAP